MPDIRPLLTSPASEAELLAQAQQLSGYTLGELAALAGMVTPKDLKRDKGWIGVLLEIWLGASAGSKPEQDFAALTGTDAATGVDSVHSVMVNPNKSATSRASGVIMLARRTTDIACSPRACASRISFAVMSFFTCFLLFGERCQIIHQLLHALRVMVV